MVAEVSRESTNKQETWFMLCSHDFPIYQYIKKDHSIVENNVFDKDIIKFKSFELAKEYRKEIKNKFKRIFIVEVHFNTTIEAEIELDWDKQGGDMAMFLSAIKPK